MSKAGVKVAKFHPDPVTVSFRTVGLVEPATRMPVPLKRCR